MTNALHMLLQPLPHRSPARYMGHSSSKQRMVSILPAIAKLSSAAAAAAAVRSAVHTSYESTGHRCQLSVRFAWRSCCNAQYSQLLPCPQKPQLSRRLHRCPFFGLHQWLRMHAAALHAGQ